MTCDEIGSVLDTVDQHVPSPAQRRAIGDHLAACRACREAWAAYDELAAAAVPSMPPDLPVRVAGALEASGARPVRRRRPILAAGLFVVGAAVAGAIAWRSGGPVPQALPRVEQGVPPARITAATTEPVAEGSTRTTEGAAAGEAPQPSAVLDPNSIVVLPQPGADADPRFAKLLQDFYEELLVQLSAINGSTVVSRERVQPFMGSLLPEEEIARQLGAGTIVVLGIHGEAEPVMITATAFDGASGAHRWNSTHVLREPVTRAEVRDHAQNMVASIEERRTLSEIDLQTYIAATRETILNSALSEGERAEALGRLPLHVTGAYDDAIVAAAVEIATTSESANLRAHVWQSMNGVGHRYLIEPLLQALTYDPSDYVRRVVASTLGDFPDEPRVQSALARAQARDPSEAVREAARLALLSDQERNELALQTLLDATLPASERLQALRLFDGRNLRPVPLTAEAARAVFDIGTNSKDVATRSIAWSKLARSGIRNSAFTGALLDDVANHPSKSVRSAAARALEAYRDDPDVRAALELAKMDPSAEVRRAARSVPGETVR